MKDPSLSRRRRPNLSKKLKLVISFNGTFQPRPPSGKLRYTGGETRIVSVDRNIGFSRLQSKISELLCCPNNDHAFTLKYHLPDSESLDEDTPLVLITSDDDVLCMIDEYDKLESYGKHTRLWIFVCNDNGYVDRHTVNTDAYVNFVDTENLNNGFGGLCKNDGFDVDKKGNYVKSVSKSLCGNVLESRNSVNHICGRPSGGDKVKKTRSVTAVRADDDSLRKLVLKQQLLTKQSAQIRSLRGGLGLAVGQTENGNYDHPLINLTSEPESPLCHETTNPNFIGDLYRVNRVDYKYMNTQAVGSENFCNLVHLRVSHSHPLNPMDGNPRVESNSSVHSLSGQSRLILGNGGGTSSCSSSQFILAVQFPKPSCNSNMNSMVPCSDSKCELRNVEPALLNNMNRENIMPWGADCNTVRAGSALSCSNQLVGSVYPMKSSHGSDRVQRSFYSGIRNHRFGLNDTRNQRTCPYHTRNHRSYLTEMGNHRNVRVDGRRWVGKFYPGLSSSSNISKQGQAMRSYYPTSWKPWSGSHDQKVEGLARTMDYGINNQTCLFDLPYGGQENLREQGGLGVRQYGMPNPKECRLACHRACTGTADQSLLPLNATENTALCTRAVDTQVDLLTGPGSEKHEVPCQPLCKNLLAIPMNGQTSCDIKEEPYLMDQQEVANISNFPNNQGYSNGKLSDREAGCKSFSNQNGAHILQGGIGASVDLSFYNLSLSSSKEEELPATCSPASNDISEALLKPQSKLLDLMDEEHFSSGPQIEKSSGIASHSSSHTAAKMEKEEIEQDPQSGLSFDEKDDIRKKDKCSNVNGGIPADLATFYTHIATKELQTIKNSDLEYIKELGSGTYGTVFYGKWKGSDVAIKRLKPSCFTEGAAEEDRLVADFWKEAHILGHLHHPNIVALYGVVTDGPVTNLATVTEYMVNGSLKQVLRRKDRTIDRRKRLIIAMDAAFGMEYLHEKNIVHFDLKSHNFLVNMKDPQRPVCKIGDLGLSKIKQKTLISGGVRGTIPWMAPELLNSKNMVTEKVDVYSFGIVMWELLTGEEPYANLRSEEIIAGIIKGNLRPEIPSWCDPAWRSLMERCWSSDPDARPAFSEIAKELRALAAAMNIK